MVSLFIYFHIPLRHLITLDAPLLELQMSYSLPTCGHLC